MHWPGVWWAIYRVNECTGLGCGGPLTESMSALAWGVVGHFCRVNECTGLGRGGALTELMSALAWGVVGHLPSQ